MPSSTCDILHQMHFEVQQGDVLRAVSVRRSSDGSVVSAEADGQQAQVTVLSAGPPYVVSVDGRVYEVRLAENREVSQGAPGAWDASTSGPRHGQVTAQLRSEYLLQQVTKGTEGSKDGQLRSPIPGRVLRVLVDNGDEVANGQAVLVIEAMKMENELFSPAAGRITDLHVKAGDAVEAQALLLRVSPKD